MPYPTDDLAPTMMPPRENPGLLYGEGILVSFNPDTLENEVAFRGSVLRNLRIQASGFDALTWVPGNLVSLHGYSPRRGAGVWWIAARIIEPGPGAAVELLAAMTGKLARAVAAQVFADRMHSVDAVGSVDTGSESFVSLSGGPVVSDVDVSDAGEAIVIATSQINAFATTTGESAAGGSMSFEATGAGGVVWTPDDSRGVVHGHNKATGSSGCPGGGSWDRSSSLTRVTGLSAGAHTFTAKYRTREDANFSNAFFFNRNLTVIAF